MWPSGSASTVSVVSAGIGPKVIDRSRVTSSLQKHSKNLLDGLRSITVGQDAAEYKKRSHLAGQSSLAARANERADEFGVQFEPSSISKVCETVLENSPRHGGHVLDLHAMERAEKEMHAREARYQELVKDIDAAIHGTDLPITPLHANKVIIDRVGDACMTTRLYYMLRLPHCRAQVDVHMTRETGPMPAMYVSTTVQRPSPEENDFTALDGEVSYQHDHADDDEEGAAHHHEGAAHHHGESTSSALYICVAGSDAVSAFRLRCSVRRGPLRHVVATDHGETSASHLVDAQGLGWASGNKLSLRLQKLTREPLERERLEESNRRFRHKRRLRWTQNFRKINATDIYRHAPELQDEQRQQKKLTDSEHFSKVLQNAQQIEQRKEEHFVELCQRDQVRQNKREEEARRAEKEARRENRRQAWIEKFALISYTVNLLRRVEESKKLYVRMMLEWRASIKIQKFVLLSLSQWRRQGLYRNLIMLRMALPASTRHLRPAAYAVITPRIKWFLHVHALSKELPDVSGMVKRFLGRVRLVQRNFRRLRLSQAARTEALMNRFHAAEFIDMPVEAHHESFHPSRTFPKSKHRQSPDKGLDRKTPRKTQAAEHIAATPRGPRRGSNVTAPPTPQMHATQPRQSTGVPHTPQMHPTPSSRMRKLGKRLSIGDIDPLLSNESGDHRRRSVTLADGEHAFIRDYKGEELLPYFVRFKAVKNHVREMQRNLYERVQEWEKRRNKKENQMAAALQAWGFGDSTDLEQKVGPRPRPVELHRLKDLYASTYEAWIHGEYRSVVHYRRKILSTFWVIWIKIVKGERFGSKQGSSSSIFDMTPMGRESSRKYSIGMTHEQDGHHRGSVSHARKKTGFRRSMTTVFAFDHLNSDF